jgi:hypothetical protein
VNEQIVGFEGAAWALVENADSDSIKPTAAMSARRPEVPGAPIHGDAVGQTIHEAPP